MSWEDISGKKEYSFLEATQKNIHGAKQLITKSRKLLKHSWRSVNQLNSYGSVQGQKSGLPPICYIKHRGSGIRAPFFKYEEGVFIGIFVFYKQTTDQENEKFQDSVSVQESIINWIRDNEGLYQEIIQRS